MNSRAVDNCTDLEWERYLPTAHLSCAALCSSMASIWRACPITVSSEIYEPKPEFADGYTISFTRIS